jgi:hypothetical protein
MRRYTLIALLVALPAALYAHAAVNPEYELGDPLANDAAALTYIQANFYDTNADGTGTARQGQCYFNTTDDTRRCYDGAGWFETDANTTIAGNSTTHIASNGSDHANVVLNDTHRASAGTDHSDVGLNNTHRGSNGTDHSYIDQDVTIGSSPTFAEVRYSAERAMLTLSGWAGGPLGGPPGGAVSYLESIDFAAGGGEDIISSFVLSSWYVPGRDLSLEFRYSSDTAVASNALFSSSCALYRPGTDGDVAPPGNLHADAANSVAESVPADTVELMGKLEITDAAGQINSITPSVGDSIACKIERDAGDPSAGVFRVYPDALVYMEGP